MCARMLIRQDERIVTDWYQKPTASGRLLNYFSGHKLQQKRNVAFNLFLRILSLSDEQFHPANIDKAFKILENNNYPRKVIVSQMNRAKQRIATGVRTTAPPIATDDTLTAVRRSMTYVHGLSEPIAHILQQKAPNLKLSFKPHQQLQSSVFTRLKQRTLPTDKTNCVYEIPCGGSNADGSACELSYVGQTKNQLFKRVREHKYSCNKVDRERERR